MANPIGRILAIDDDPNIRELLRARLSSHGYSVVLAEDGPTGLEAVAQEIPDLVIVDLMMPGMDGLSFVKRLRANPETESLPVLMLSARDRSIDKTMGLESGVDDYLGKPFNSAELMARIAALLRRSRREQPQTTEPLQRGRLIAFVGAKGGVGTTTVAANLGVALARAGTSTILVDLAPPPERWPPCWASPPAAALTGCRWPGRS